MDKRIQYVVMFLSLAIFFLAFVMVIIYRPAISQPQQAPYIKIMRSGIGCSPTVFTNQTQFENAMQFYAQYSQHSIIVQECK